ncbi:MAG TPA: hypothetical protein VGQ57_13520 [Polyangiaceae bacterium]|nr:hypothetical protein [Polyangiaceae bacterium]
MLNDILLFGALLLIGLKFGLRARLREIGKVLDRIVNLLLVVIVAGYVVQILFLWITRR